MSIVKGTVSQDFSSPVFFIKQFLLVPMGMPRSDFKFLQIFVEFFVFVIDSPVMNTPGSHDFPVMNTPRSLDSPVVNTPGSRPKLVNIRTF